MAPLNPNEALGWLGAGLLSLAIGFFFGFVLEQAGFGNARKLAAQFYFRDMTVLKVMFTAIVVAMLFLSIGAGLGFVDMERIWVNPTYLWPGILGGFVLGLGFIIGGYCPGTSLVSMVTFKIDGLFFVFGVMFGILVFGEVAGFFPAFYYHAGSLGRLTLPEWLGVSPAAVVFAVALMALFAFWAVEKVERLFGDRGAESAGNRRGLQVGAGLLAAGAFAALAVGQPTTRDRVAMMGPELEKGLSSRQFHIDAGEVLDLMSNNRIRLMLIDVRSEADYNLFHLIDARRIAAQEWDAPSLRRVPAEAVKVVMSNDEAAAEEAWKYFRAGGMLNVYILEGGINRWLDIYGSGELRRIATAGHNDRLRYQFAHVVGSRHPAASPHPSQVPKRDYQRKVKVLAPVSNAGGGCG
jgi:rhodanese-related sulfurtransferase